MPDSIQGLEVFWPQGVILGSFHGTKCYPANMSDTLGFDFPLFEEMLVNTLASVSRQQNRFCTVKNLIEIITGSLERCLKVRLLVAEGEARRCANDLSLIQGQHRDAVIGVDIGLQIIPLVIHGAIVEIGEIAEYTNTEFCELVEPLGDIRAFYRNNVYAHVRLSLLVSLQLFCQGFGNHHHRGVSVATGDGGQH